ncbi:hypothetical protein GPK34_04885 [Secundilactobacillus kimchicus]|uniref:DUF5776 domain-containing protein n=1 Tax=Secundilactobacillus kimchicus TaxID=528209 RepID=UPI001C0158F2|nr:DUF5776 domain-containing protein [Secundilactobacillus kimchicus]MBT9671370.1 hypothetical protein [Secundilactobacillus kimchicus]
MSTHKLLNRLLISAAVLGGMTMGAGIHASAETTSTDNSGEPVSAAIKTQGNESTENSQQLQESDGSSSLTEGSNQSAVLESPQGEEAVSEKPETAAENSQGLVAESDSQNDPQTESVNETSDLADPQLGDVAEKQDQQTPEATNPQRSAVTLRAVAPTQQATGEITIRYVDQDTGQTIPVKTLGKNTSIPTTAATTFNDDGSVTFTTTAPVDSTPYKTVGFKMAQPLIAGYQYVGPEANAAVSFAPIGTENTVTINYQKLADVNIKYVDEDDPAVVLYELNFIASKSESGIVGGEDYDASKVQPVFYNYTYDAAKTAASQLTGTFKTATEIGATSQTLYVYYKKTGTSTDKPNIYVNDGLGVSNTNIGTSGDTSDAATDLTKGNGSSSSTGNPSDTFTTGTMPATAVQVTKQTDTTPAVYQNYTNVATVGFKTSDINKLRNITYVIPNQPVKVVFADATTNTILDTRYMGAFDAQNNVIPSGAYDTATIQQEVEPALSAQHYRLIGSYGLTSGTYDMLNRTVYYMYAPTISSGEATSTRTIYYEYADGSQAAVPVIQTVTYKSETNDVTGDVVYTAQNPYGAQTSPTISGFTPDKMVVDQLLVGASKTIPGDTQVTVVYTKAANPNPGETTNTGTGTPTSTPETTPETTSPITIPTVDGKTGLGDSTILAKGEAVYAINNIYMYKNPTFKVSQRIEKYVKKPRINRPMFVVIGYAYSKDGRLRYKVRDVNHLSSTAGKVGYITANTDYVVPVYYQSTPAKITVINPTGVNAYRNVNLTGKNKNYKQGTVLTVKRIVHHNLTTRFVLSDGSYITANRKLVIAGTYTKPTSITTKHVIHRYTTADANKRNGSFAKGRTIKVLGWTYSRQNSHIMTGTIRYRVAGGYITANSKYVD